MADNKPTKVVINFPTQQHAEEFVSWMCNQGEQDYWTAMDCQEPSLPQVQFKYAYEAKDGVCNVDATL